MVTANKVTVGLIQMKASPSSESNLEKTIRKVREAARKGAQIISLQELFKTHYFPQTKDPRHFDLAESIPGPTTKIFSQLARKLKVVIVVPVFEKHDAKVYYNTAVVVDTDGEIVGKYRKMHLPNDPCFYEKFYFAKGNLGFKSFKTKFCKIGVLICWDQWFPEAARLMALSGTQILFYPTAIGWFSRGSRKTQLEEKNAWEMVQHAHAIANGIYVAVANRVGREGRLTFWGNSFVAGPFGETIARMSEAEEEVLIAKCDFSKINQVRKVWPFLRERRADAYRGLTARF